MGYGLVDAYAAVRMADCMLRSPVTVSGTKTGTNNITGSSITIQNAIFKSNSNTKVNACGSILINPRTVIESGSKVVITRNQ